ncbi:MAG TPA: glycosyltransferase family 1 protein [Propionibacteriaceae bacterium]
MFPVFDGHGGGGYQYSLMILRAMDQLRGELEPVIVHDRAGRKVLQPWTSSGWQVMGLGRPTLRTIARRAIVRAFGEPAAARTGAVVQSLAGAARGRHTSAPWETGNRSRRGRRVAARLSRNGIELMLFSASSTLAFQTGVPYIMTIHDLQHRIHPEFPEVSANGQWKAREFLYANGVRFAEAILVDSEVGREDVLEFYGHLTSPDRVRILPFVPPPYLVRPTANEVSATLRSLRVPGCYLLFPAQFWPHKNHRRVVEAVAALHREGLDVTVLMTGSASGHLRTRVLSEVRGIVAHEGIGNLVQILGYVDDTAMAALYAGASGVLLPTFFGPTNIPVIEAWAVGVPVLTSDIRGIREQCGDAAILVDPLSTEAITEGIRQLWTDDALRERLVVAGTERVRDNDPAAFRDELASILRDVEQTVRTREPQRMPA